MTPTLIAPTRRGNEHRLHPGASGAFHEGRPAFGRDGRGVSKVGHKHWRPACGGVNARTFTKRQLKVLDRRRDAVRRAHDTAMTRSRHHRDPGTGHGKRVHAQLADPQRLSRSFRPRRGEQPGPPIPLVIHIHHAAECRQPRRRRWFPACRRRRRRRRGANPTMSPLFSRPPAATSSIIRVTPNETSNASKVLRFIRCPSVEGTGQGCARTRRSAARSEFEAYSPRLPHGRSVIAVERMHHRTTSAATAARSASHCRSSDPRPSA